MGFLRGRRLAPAGRAAGRGRRCAGSDRAGTCDPSRIVSPEVAAVLGSVDAVFPNPTPGLERFPGFYAGPRSDYVQLCVRQLCAGMLTLARTCLGGGTVFPVDKANHRQRVVWHGTRVSDAAAAPPKPRHLASPSVFGFVELRDGRLLRVSKRDCRTWFDQLLLPGALSRFMARPRIWVQELELLPVSTGAELADGVLLEQLRCQGDSVVHCSYCWFDL